MPRAAGAVEPPRVSGPCTFLHVVHTRAGGGQPAAPRSSSCAVRQLNRTR